MFALSENIRTLRRARGLSQEELACRLGVSRQSVSLWEQGETNPSVENIYSMSEVLCASFDELMGSGAPTAETSSKGNVEPLERPEVRRSAYQRYRRLIVGAWISAGVMFFALLLFIFAVAVLGDYAIKHPESVIQGVIGPTLMLVSMALFLVSGVTLVIMSVRAVSHRRQMGDFFHLALHERVSDRDSCAEVAE